MRGKLLNSLIGATLALMSASGFALDRYGDWTTGVNDLGYPYAATMNDSGSGLMHLCNTDTQMCYWYIVMDSSCDEGVRTPALFSSASGTSMHHMQCETSVFIGGRKMYRLTVDNYEAIDTHSEQTGIIGVALPLEGGQFKVIRFSLRGSSNAIAAMTKAAKAKPPSKAVSDGVL